MYERIAIEIIYKPVPHTYSMMCACVFFPPIFDILCEAQL